MRSFITSDRNLFLLIAVFIFSFSGSAQCPVTASANVSTIYCGEEVKLSATGTPGFYIFENNFNSGTIGTGWQATSTAMFNNPCGPGPGGSTNPHMWMGSSAAAPRNATTSAYDLSTGGTICFDMRYAIQGDCPAVGTCDCEGPDLPDEGVHLQYSTDGGATWIDIQYWNPNGGNDPQMTNWNRYCVTIPPGAMTSSTMIKWAQLTSSNAGSDHWGLDNITIATNDPNFMYDWAHDGLPPASTSATPSVYPTTTTTYTVTYANSAGTSSCTATVTVNVAAPTVTATTSSANICQGSSAQLIASSSLTYVPPTTCGSTTSACPANSDAAEIQLGSGTTLSQTGNPGIGYLGASNFDGAVRSQFLLKASALNAAGITACKFNSMQFDIASNSIGAKTFNNFSISFMCTSLTALPDNYVDMSAGAVVFTPQNLTLTSGWQSVFFNNGYNWDGTSNIIINICWQSNTSATIQTRHYATTYVATTTDGTNTAGTNNWDCSDNTDPFTTGYSSLPNFKFGICKKKPGTLVYSWSPTTGLSSSSIYNPVATPAASTTYTVSVLQSGAPAACASTASVAVNVVTSNMTGVNASRCGTGTVTVSTTGCTGTINWYAAATGGSSIATGSSFTTPSISSTTTYYATCTQFGCESPRVPVTATVNPVPSSAFTISPATICAGVNTTITYTGTALTGAVYNWNFNGGTIVSGSGQGPYTVNWPNPTGGTYNVSLSVSANGCTSTTTTQPVVVTPGPALTINPSAPSYCAPGSVSLTGTAVMNPATYNTSGTNATDFTIPDNGVTAAWDGVSGAASTFVNSPVTISGLNPSAWTLTSICLDITHGRDFDIIVYLINPCGGKIRLILNAGGTGANFSTTCFTPSASNVIGSAGNNTAPFNGTFAPQAGTAAWAAFLACGSPNGTWQLHVGDAAGGISIPLNTGTLTNWSINFSSTNYVTSYTWSPATNLSSTTTATTTASPSVTTTYSLTVMDAVGCPATKPVTVTVNNPPSAPTAVNGSRCGTGTVNLSVTGCSGTANWYNAASGGTSLATGASFTTPSISSTTTYYATCTVNGCESARVAVVATVNTPPAPPTAGNNGPVCVGAPLSLTANTIAGTYSWTGPNGFTSSSEDPSVSANATTAMAGTYSVTITSSGCTSIAGTTTVVVNPVPSAPVAGNNGPVCAGAALNLNANTLAGTYSWTGPNGFTSSSEDPSVSANATTAMAGTYSVTITSSGCTSIAGTTTVVVNPVPSAPVAGNNGPVCAGAALNLNANTLTGTYSWTGPNGFISSLEDPTVSTNATAVMAGTYSVTITSSGCTSAAATTTVVVNAVPSAPVAGNNGPVCAGAALNLNANTLTGTYSWTGPNGFTSSSEDPSVSANATTAMAGTYSVTITSSGCTSVAGTTTVVVNSIPSAPLAGNNGPVCAGAALNLNANTLTGTYSWTGPNGFISSSEDPSVSANATAAMAGTYSVTITTNGCTSVAGTTTVVVNSIPSAPVAGNNGPVCAGAALNLSANTLTGTYSWTGPNGFISSSEDPSVSANATTAMAGTYSVTITSSGCTSVAGTTTVIVNTIPSAPVAGNNGPVCTGAALNLNANTLTGIYSWTGPNGFVSSSEDPSVSANATTAMAGTYSVTITTNGCTSAAGTTTVVVNPPVVPAAGNNGPVCVGASLNLNTNTVAGATYSWIGPNGFISSSEDPSVSASATTAMAGTYSVTITVSGCTSSPGTTTVTVNTLPTANAGGDKTLSCIAPSVTLDGSSGTAGVTYSWSGPGGFSSSSATPNASTAGTYTLTTSINGCSASDQMIVNPAAGAPDVNAGTSQTLTCTTTTTILNGSSSTPGVNFNWSGPGIVSGGSSTTPTVNAAGSYTLTVTDPGSGCSATGQVAVINNTTAPDANAGTPQTINCSSSSVVLNGSSATGSATFNWSGPGITSGATTATPTVNAAGTYTLTVTDPSNGCTAPAQVIVNSNTTAPNANAGTAQTLSCSATSVTLNGSSSTGGATFSWSGAGIVSGGTTTTPTVNTTGTYTLTVTDPSNGCTATSQVTVNSNSTLPDANAGAPQTLNCSSSSATLNGSSATAGAGFSWAGPAIASGGNTATPTVNAAGTYTITVTDASNGCTATAQVTVSANTTQPNANAGAAPTLTCSSTSAALNGSSSTLGATFSWTGPGITSGGNTAAPIVNAAGTYELTVTDPSNGCTSTAQVIVSSNTNAPNADAGATQTLTCSATAVTLNGSSSTAGTTFSWTGPGIVSGGSTATPSVNAAGIYTLTVTDPSNGCTSNNQVVVNASSAVPNANAGTSQTLDCTGGTVSLNGSSSTAGATFSWAGPGIISGGTTATPTVNAAGTYDLTVTDPSNGCTAAAQVIVNSNTSAPNASAGSPQTLTCTASTVTLNGSSTNGSVSYSWAGPGIVSGASSATPAVNTAGTYTLTVTDPANGCSASDQVVVNASTAAPNANAGTSATLNCSAASVSLNGSSSTSGATFSWSGPGIISGGNTATPTVNAAGTYDLTVTDPANGCTSAAQVVVNSNTTAPDANAGTNQTLTCTTTAVTLNGSSATSGATFNWSGPGVASGGNSATPTVNASGTYTVTVTDPANGCTATNQVTVNTAAGVPDANAGTAQTLTCSSTTVVLNGSSATSGVTYNWSGPGIVSGGNTAAPTVNTSGTYDLTVTDPSNGCTATAQVTVSSNTAAPAANAGSAQTLTCSATSVILNGSSTGGTTYSWTGPGIVSGGNTATPSVNAAGTYTLTVTDASNGCSDTSQVIVNAAAGAPDANAGAAATLTCSLGSTTLNGSSATSGATFSWAGSGIVSGANTATPTVNAAGTYSLTVTDPSNGCTSAAQVVVNSNTTAPDANAGAAQSLTCTSTSVTLNGSSFTSGATFSWTGPGIVSGGNTATPSVNAAGTYNLIVTDPANGCTATSQVIVNSAAGAPDANAGAPQTLTCTTTSSVLNGSSATSGATFSWTGPGITSGGNTATPSVNAAGTYNLIVTDPANGCTSSAQVIVNSNTTPPDANAGNTQSLSCSAPSVNLNGSSSTAGATFSWAGPGIASGGNTATPTVNAAGTYNLIVTDPANGCTATSQVTVNGASGAPNANAGTAQTLTCSITTVVLSGSSSTSGVSFNWTGAGIISGANTATPSVNTAGTYTLTVTDPSNGCAAQSQVNVFSNTTPPDANAGAAQALTCTSSSLTLNGSSATSGATFSWAGAGIVSGGGTATPTINAAGTYTLTTTSPSNGCTANATVTVSAPAGITVDAGADVIISSGETTALSASGASAYTWSPVAGLSCTSCPNPLASPTVTTTYCLTGLIGSCSDNDCVTVKVHAPCDASTDLGMPNAFSPNNDGNNDLFCIQGWSECMNQFSILIYDRWGEKVFEASAADFCWDGTFRGKTLDPAVFVYIINASYITGEQVTKKGNISIIR